MMAIVHGEIIKAERKKRKMSQTELAEGICKQATISNIERKNFCKDIEILTKVCRKLELTLPQVIQSSPEDWLDDQLDEVEDLSSSEKNQEALAILEKIDMTKVQDKKLIHRYYYNFGNCLMLAKKDNDGALFYFNQVLAQADANDLYGILSNAGIALTYVKKKQYTFAKTYCEKAIAGVEGIPDPKPLSLNRVLLQAAKFYNLVEEPETAKNLALEGIAINQHFASTKLLEYLVLELAESKKQLAEKDAKDAFNDAKKMALFNHNQKLATQVEKELKAF